MSHPASWWKNSTLILTLACIPLVIASIPPSAETMPDETRVALEEGSPSAGQEKPSETPSNPEAKPSEPAAVPAAETPAAAPATESSTPPVAAPAAEDPELAEWRRDVEERIHKAAISEILVALGENHAELDQRVVTLEKLEREVKQLRAQLEYLEKLRSDWDRHSK